MALAGCGGGEQRDADAPEGTFTVSVERASFPAEQRLAGRADFILELRNAGPKTIPNLVVTVRGFTALEAGGSDADRRRDVWIVDDGPAGAATAFDDTWAAGRLEPGRSATLRWELTPVVAGRHQVSYEIAPATEGPARAELVGGAEPRGTLTVRVTDKPARARVDPRTGQVLRDE